MAPSVLSVDSHFSELTLTRVSNTYKVLRGTSYCMEETSFWKDWCTLSVFCGSIESLLPSVVFASRA